MQHLINTKHPYEGRILEHVRIVRPHHNDVIMGSMASQITSLTIVYPAVYSGADQRKHQSSASLAFMGGIHQGPVNSPRKWPATRKMFPFDDVFMLSLGLTVSGSRHPVRMCPRVLWQQNPPEPVLTHWIVTLSPYGVSLIVRIWSGIY